MSGRPLKSNSQVQKLAELRKITAISEQKKAADRVNIYLDGTFAFGLAVEAAIGLQPGMLLSEEAILSLQDQDSFFRAKHAGIGLIAYRPRSSAEVRRSLLRKGYEETIVEQAVLHLEDKDLLDDRSFADYWVEQRMTFKPRSRRALQYELRQKGVANAIIEQALAAVDEEETARRAAAQRSYRWAHLDRDSYQKKMTSFLRQRGFGYQVVREIVVVSWEDLKRNESPS